MRRLWLWIALAGLLLTLLAARRGAPAAASAAGAAGFVALNLWLLQRGLAVVIFRLKRRQVAWGLAGIFARMALLLGSVVFAIIHRSRIDTFGLALGGMAVVLAGFLEVSYILFREIRQRCIMRG